MNGQENQPLTKKEEVTESVPSSQRQFFNRVPWRYLVGGVVILLLIWGGRRLLKGKNNSFSSRQVTLTYWGLWEPESVVRGVIAQFEKDHPQIKINYQKHSPRDYKARLQNALAAGKGPDIFRFHHTWLPLFKKQLAPVPASVEEKLDLKNAYFSVISQSLQDKGTYYALPLMIDTLALYYNQDLVGEKQLPRTWWGLQQKAKQLTQRDEEGRIEIAGVALGTTNNVDHWSDIVGLMLLQNGADPAQPQDQLVEDVLQYYVLFTTKDHVWDETLPASTLMFAAGKLAFYFAPSWRYFEIKENNPQLRFGIAPVPQLPQTRQIDWEEAEKGGAELTNINWASFWVEGVSAHSAHPAQAWEFLSYLASAEGLQYFYQAASEVRDFGEIYPRVALAQSLEQNPYLKPFVTQAKSARWWYLCSFTHDDSLNDGMIKYYQDAVNSILAGDDPSLVTETLAQGVQQLVERFSLSPTQ